MSNINKEYVLEIANLYGIEINENSDEHLVEDINGNITKLKKEDIPKLFGIELENAITWYSVENVDFNINTVIENSINVKFNSENNMYEFTADELIGVA